MLDMFVTAAVLNSGADLRDVQTLNMKLVSVTLAVEAVIITDCRLRQLLNKF